MRHLFYRQKGAINVFLVIILVPILIITCLFVDASRAKLVGGLVSSAGDLTLNTVLTQYDAELDDFYGFLGSDPNNAKAVIAQADTYFMSSVSSKAANSTGSRGTINDIIGAFGGGSGAISDLLQIESGGTFTVNTLDNGTLSNPALIKKQVVEFMKYRAPIEEIGDLLDKFKGVSKDLENASKDSETIEKKQEFVDAEGALMAKLMEAYTDLLAYNEYGITADYISKMKTDLDEVEEKYRIAHKITVKNLYNTQGRNLLYNWGDIDSDPGVEYDQDQVNGYIFETAEAINRFIPVASNFASRVGTLEAWSTSFYPIQYWVYADNILHDSYVDFCRKANSLSKSMKKLDIVMGILEQNGSGEDQEDYVLAAFEGVDTSGQRTRKEHYDSLNNQYKSLWNNYITGNDTPFQYVCENIIGGRFTSADLSTSQVVNEYIVPVYNQLNEYYTKFDDADKELEKAYQLLKQAKQDAQDYRDHYDEWSALSKSYESTLSKEEREEAEKYKTDKKEKGDILENATPENIENLMQRIGNIRGLIGSVKKGIDEYKYNGKKVREISTYDQFRNASGINEDKISKVANELENYASESFKFTSSDTLNTIGITDNNNPSFDVATPPMYNWLKKKFKEYAKDLKEGNADNKKKDGENQKKDTEKEYKKEEKDLKEEGNIKGGAEINGQPNLPSAGQSTPSVSAKFSSDIKQVSGFVSGLFKNFSGTVGQAAINLRDHLYTMSYIFNMFTYDTYDNEGRFRLLKGEGATYGNYQSKYDSKNSEWQNEDPVFRNNKTLTNKILNGTTELSFGNEVEYILYGGSNAENKLKAYASIFGVRFALNMPAEFIRYWTPSAKYPDSEELQALAASICALTYGVIPEAAVKLIVILGLTAYESSRDLQYLKAGMPLKLVKSADDLEITFNHLVPDNNKVQKESLDAFFYSDYLKLFMFLNLLSNSSEYVIYARIGDVVQVNMAKNKSGFNINNSVVYYKAEGSVKVKPLMLTLPIVTNNGYGAPADGGWNSIKYEDVRGY